MEIRENQANQTKYQEVFRKRKTCNTRWKNLSFDHQLEISTRQDSCSIQEHYKPSTLTSLYVLKPSKFQLAIDCGRKGGVA